MDGYNSEKFQNKLVEIQKANVHSGWCVWLLKSKKIVDKWTLFYIHILQNIPTPNSKLHFFAFLCVFFIICPEI
jgi:hypothetical protein